MNSKQECIPVGCVPPACWLYPSMLCPRGGVCPGGVCPGGVCRGGLPRGVWQTPLWTEWQTGVKILPCRDFVAGGNSSSHQRLRNVSLAILSTGTARLSNFRSDWAKVGGISASPNFNVALTLRASRWVVDDDVTEMTSQFPCTLPNNHYASHSDVDHRHAERKN